jgi:quercetin dioxygenase-like cupin family protein
MTFYLEDGQLIPASAGSFVHIPEGYVPHAFQVGSETARFLVLTRLPTNALSTLLLSRRRHEPSRRQNRPI